jgi:hypothetical protein
MFRPERYAGLHLHGKPRLHFHSPVLGDRCREEYSFHPRKLLADADACSTAERKVGIPGTLGLRIGRPSSRVEAVRIWKESCVAVRDVLAHQDNCAGRNSKAACLEGFDRSSSDCPRRWEKAHGLGQDHARVWKAVDVIDTGLPSAKHFIDFRVKPGFGFGIL